MRAAVAAGPRRRPSTCATSRGSWQRFPEARFIHVVRDGRDVVCSMRQHPDRRWVDGAWVKVHRPLSLEQYAERWVADTEAGVAHRGDPRYLEVRYEDLVQDPLAVLRGLLMDLGEAFDPRSWWSRTRAHRDRMGATTRGRPSAPVRWVAGART